MKILSYNVLANSATHHLAREGIDPYFLTRKHRTPLISTVLVKSNADVICLQEVDDISFEEYTRVLPDYIGRLELKKNKNFGVATFWRRNDNIEQDSTVLKFNDRSGQRSLVLNMGKYVIFNVHLDFKLGNSQVEQIIDSMDFSKNIIICGDFNAIPSSETLGKLYNVGFSTLPTGHTFSKEGYKKVIDFILCRTCELKRLRRVAYIKNNIPDANNGSDHIPILGTVRM